MNESGSRSGTRSLPRAAATRYVAVGRRKSRRLCFPSYSTPFLARSSDHSPWELIRSSRRTRSERVRRNFDDSFNSKRLVTRLFLSLSFSSCACRIPFSRLVLSINYLNGKPRFVYRFPPSSKLSSFVILSLARTTVYVAIGLPSIGLTARESQSRRRRLINRERAR